MFSSSESPEIGHTRSSSRKAPVRDDKILTVLGPDAGMPPIILGFLYSNKKEFERRQRIIDCTNNQSINPAFK